MQNDVIAQKRWGNALTFRSVRCSLLQNNIDLLEICSTYPGQSNLVS